jgi:hypothetical protein
LSLHACFLRHASHGEGRSSFWSLNPAVPVTHRNARKKSLRKLEAAAQRASIASTAADSGVRVINVPLPAFVSTRGVVSSRNRASQAVRSVRAPALTASLPLPTPSPHGGGAFMPLATYLNGDHHSGNSVRSGVPDPKLWSGAAPLLAAARAYGAPAPMVPAAPTTTWLPPVPTPVCSNWQQPRALTRTIADAARVCVYMCAGACLCQTYHTPSSTPMTAAARASDASAQYNLNMHLLRATGGWAAADPAGLAAPSPMASPAPPFAPTAIYHQSPEQAARLWMSMQQFMFWPPPSNGTLAGTGAAACAPGPTPYAVPYQFAPALPPATDPVAAAPAVALPPTPAGPPGP